MMHNGRRTLANPVGTVDVFPNHSVRVRQYEDEYLSLSMTEWGQRRCWRASNAGGWAGRIMLISASS